MLQDFNIQRKYFEKIEPYRQGKKKPSKNEIQIKFLFINKTIFGEFHVARF
jgi:hypothetical protein